MNWELVAVFLEGQDRDHRASAQVYHGSEYKGREEHFEMLASVAKMLAEAIRSGLQPQ